MLTALITDSFPSMDSSKKNTDKKNADVFSLLESLIAQKEQQVLDIEQAIERYEKRRLREEQSYQSMSGLRRLLTGKKNRIITWL